MRDTLRGQALQPPVKPTQTFKFQIITWVLDMRTATDLLGKDLSELITRSVFTIQHPILQPLPDWLMLTERQFVSLLDFTEPLEDGGLGGRIFITPFNVMEVDVDLETDPLSDAEALEIGDNIWAMSPDWGNNA